MLSNDPLEVCESALGHNPNRGADVKDGGIGEAVMDKQSLLAALDQGGLPQGLQMLGRVGQRQSSLAGEGVDRPFSLSEELEDLHPMGTSEGFADAGKLGVEGGFELTMWGWHML
jgi:hypothetical protein